MKTKEVKVSHVLRGREVTFKTDEGDFKAYEADSTPVEPYLIGISLFHAELRVCPHMIEACCNFEEVDKEPNRMTVESPGMKLACNMCLGIEDMDSLKVASWSAGRAFRLDIIRFPDGLHGCWLTTPRSGEKIRMAAFQGLGYECIAHWQRIAKDSGFKVMKPLSQEHDDEVKLSFVSENI
jgi:hypothetical protein